MGRRPLGIRSRRAIAWSVSLIVAIGLTALIDSELLRRNRLADALHDASSSFIQLSLEPPHGDLPVRVVLLSRLAIADQSTVTRGAVTDRGELLRFIRLLSAAGARAIALDFDLSAPVGQEYRDPEHDPHFLDTLLMIRSGTDPGFRGRAVPVVVGIVSRSFYPRDQRLGETRYAELGVSGLMPRPESHYRDRLISWISLGHDTVESMSHWLARQAYGAPLAESSIPGFRSTEVAPLVEDDENGPRVAYYFADYAPVRRLVASTITVSTPEPAPVLFEDVKDRVVILSHDDLDERAEISGPRIGDPRFRRAHLHAAGAVSLGARRPIMVAEERFEGWLAAALVVLSLVFGGITAWALRRGKRSHVVDPRVEFRITLATALGMLALCGWYCARTRLVLENVLVLVPVILVTAWIQNRLVEWLYHGLRPEVKRAHSS